MYNKIYVNKAVQKSEEWALGMQSSFPYLNYKYIVLEYYFFFLGPWYSRRTLVDLGRRSYK